MKIETSSIGDIHETARCWLRLMAVRENLTPQELERAWWVADGIRAWIEEAAFTVEERQARQFREKMADD